MPPISPMPCACARDAISRYAVVMSATMRRVLGRAHGRIACEHAKIVHAFENQRIADARTGDHVAIEPRKEIGPGPIEQHAVAADARVDDAERRARCSRAQSRREYVGPAGVAVDLTPAPSVIESPIATTAPAARLSTSTSARFHHPSIRRAPAISAASRRYRVRGRRWLAIRGGRSRVPGGGVGTS